MIKPGIVTIILLLAFCLSVLNARAQESTKPLAPVKDTTKKISAATPSGRDSLNKAIIVKDSLHRVSQPAIVKDAKGSLVVAVAVKDSTKKDSVKHKPPLRQQVHDALYVNHSPRAAGIMSAIIPGAGQAFNRKYWKIPIIYAAGGLIVYLFKDNYANYTQSTSSYKYKTDTGYAKTHSDPLPQYSSDQVKSLRQYYRRNLDLSALCGFGLYALNIVDALVDAHLYKFDVSEKLSVEWHPYILPGTATGVYGGVTFKINFVAH